jgi:L-lactate dehydrogenase complex protein LldG
MSKVMKSRATILASIKKSTTGIVNSQLKKFEWLEEKSDVQDEFFKALDAVGGKKLEVPDNQDIHKTVTNLFPKASQRYSTLKHSDTFNTVKPEELWYPHELAGLDVLILKGTLGVAENGAVWLSEKQVPIRIMPFITKHLILVISPISLVRNMHKAYERIANEHDEFGVFISGPSKTADIEQTLVIGAQGALSLHIVLATE